MYSKNIKSFPNVHLFKTTLYHMIYIFDIRQKNLLFLIGLPIDNNI